MNVALYAPLKPPDHPHPSGDRRIAQLVWQALTYAGHRVTLVSKFRSRDATGDEARQRRLRNLGEALAARLVRQLLSLPLTQRPHIWFTYHLYYKAPDWLGPYVAHALHIPYVVAEASYAPKRDKPPWQMAHRATAEAIARADAVFALNPDDVACIEPLLMQRGTADRIHRLRPFMDVQQFVAGVDRDTSRHSLIAKHGLDPQATWLICVGMLRPGDKLASYQLLARALDRTDASNWQLLVVGDGSAQAQARAAFAHFDKGRVCWLGELRAQALAGALMASDLYVWPAVNEAFGMAFLEAQACGLAVVAGNTRGVPAVVADGLSGLLAPVQPEHLAHAITQLLEDPLRRQQMGRAARAYVRREHDIAMGAHTIDLVLRRLVGEDRARC
jgi:glycosyltransferase involved in cell wall biosynthesis